MFFFFFFNDTATTEIYTLSLHDALPICYARLAMDGHRDGEEHNRGKRAGGRESRPEQDRDPRISHAGYPARQRLIENGGRRNLRNRCQVVPGTTFERPCDHGT